VALKVQRYIFHICPVACIMMIYPNAGGRKVWRYQRGNQKPLKNDMSKIKTLKGTTNMFIKHELMKL